jgi:hypothetical protein
MKKHRTYKKNISLKRVLKQTIHSFIHKFHICKDKKFRIAYIERYTSEHDKSKSLPADTEFLTL